LNIGVNPVVLAAGRTGTETGPPSGFGAGAWIGGAMKRGIPGVTSSAGLAGCSDAFAGA
jgi:hypothetical protein